jgi:hypothetical protein
MVKKKGRALDTPLTEGTAKRPCREMHQAAPDWALTQCGLHSGKILGFSVRPQPCCAKLLLLNYFRLFLFTTSADCKRCSPDHRAFFLDA